MPVLLALLPGMELTIHMIGPKIFDKIPVEKRMWKYASKELGSRLNISLTSLLYQKEFLTGQGLGPGNDGRPDAVICMNATIPSAPGWAEFIKLVAQANIPLLITETHEYATEMTRKTLERAGGRVSEGGLNPFRAPCKLFAPENNFSAFSNGYYFCLNV